MKALTKKQHELVKAASSAYRFDGHPAYCECGVYKYWNANTIASAEKKGLVKTDWLGPSVYSVYPLPYAA